MFRYVIIKYAHYGMGRMKASSSVSTESNIMKVVYFTFLIPYGLNSVIRSNLNFKDENSYYRGRVCLLQRSVAPKQNFLKGSCRVPERLLTHSLEHQR